VKRLKNKSCNHEPDVFCDSHQTREQEKKMVRYTSH